MSYIFAPLVILRGRKTGSEAFCYDTLNRLTKYNKDAYSASPACDGSGYKSAAYDALGNLTQKSDIGTYTYPVAGKAIVHAVSSISGSANGVVNPAYQYDLNGNLIGGAGRLVTWSSFNRVAEIVQATTTIDYTYDSEHKRITQALLTGASLVEKTIYLRDASGVSSEKVVNSSGTLIQWNDYLMADGRIVGQRFKTATTTSWRYYIGDHLGSTAVVTDASATVTERLLFDPWGKRTDSVTSVTTRQFTGHEQIPVPGVGLVNMNARLYDPEIARMMSADPTIPDPFSSQSFNRFTYVNNRPLSFTDPTGFCAGSRISGGGDCFGGGGGAPYAWQDCGTFNGGSLGCTTGPTRYPGCVGNCVGLAFAGGGNVNMGLPGYIPLVQHVLLSAASGGGGPRSMGNAAGMPAFRYGSHIRNPFPKAPNGVMTVADKSDAGNTASGCYTLSDGRSICNTPDDMLDLIARILPDDAKKWEYGGYLIPREGYVRAKDGSLRAVEGVWYTLFHCGVQAEDRCNNLNNLSLRPANFIMAWHSHPNDSGPSGAEYVDYDGGRRRSMYWIGSGDISWVYENNISLAVVKPRGKDFEVVYRKDVKLCPSTPLHEGAEFLAWNSECF